ncbi:MAG: phosphotransferase [Gammaproteobacteria bacterium]|nr:phosphotransferase [Gammaproteobacteria bacterium]
MKNIKATLGLDHGALNLIDQVITDYNDTPSPFTPNNFEQTESTDTKSTKFARVPGTGIHTEAARQTRLNFIKAHTATKLQHVENTSFEAKRLSNNIESFIGSIEVPVGIAGPLKINGRHASGVFYAPIATSEGALIASMSRGAYALSTAGGVTTRVLAQRMMRVPMFLFADLSRAALFANWVEEYNLEIKAEAEKHSNYARLIELTPQVFGKAVHLHFVYETGDAAGQNMTTTCTWQACLWILKRTKQRNDFAVEKFVVEGGLSSDKKVSYLSLIKGRGVRVQAEALLPARVVRRVLKTTPHDIKDIWNQFAIGATGAGIIGLNVNIANAIAGMFVSTGQDIACVHESALATTFFDVTREGDLYVCMSMPTLPIGTIGGGTRLPHQRECLEMLGCYGAGNAHKLAEIIIGFCLALDLSTTAAIVAGHFATAHEMLGRNRDINHLKLGELNEEFFQAYLRMANADATLKVKEIISLNSMESGSSLITEMTARKLKKTVGLFPFEIVYESGQRTLSQCVMAKIKPSSKEVVGALNQLASMCGAELAEEFDKYKHEVGLGGTDRRELAVYRQTDKRFTQHIPQVFGIYEDLERESFVIVQELLTDMELMDSANDVSRWTDAHLQAALKGIAACHAIWFEKEDGLKASDWLGDYPTAERRCRLMRLYGLLNTYALHEFPHWIGEKEFARFQAILEAMPGWWAKMQAMPKTLIHNDFNPRNLAFRKTTEGLRLCVYDWELATIHLPQVDVVELLAYTLANDVTPRRVVNLVNFHRQQLEQQIGKTIAADSWWEGFRYATWDFFISRMSLYLMTHAFRNYEFIERVYASLWKLLDIVDEYEITAIE